LAQFSDPHLAALAVLVVLAFASVWVGRRGRGPWPTIFARVLALAILAGWIGEYVADIVVGTWSVRYTLPLQLTDAVSLVAVLALWRRRVVLVEILYFWSLTATLQAILTPDLAYNYPSIFYFTYFTYHVGAVVATCFLVLGCRIYPRTGAARRVYMITLAFILLPAVGDLLTGGNYMYLREKPEHSSLLSLMGGWPSYIAETALLAAAMFAVLQLLADRLRRWDEGAPACGPAEPGVEIGSRSLSCGRRSSDVLKPR
jgi:hypothetical integral membrane protein (TIGR02206 family)